MTSQSSEPQSEIEKAAEALRAALMARLAAEGLTYREREWIEVVKMTAEWFGKPVTEQPHYDAPVMKIWPAPSHAVSIEIRPVSWWRRVFRRMGL